MEGRPGISGFEVDSDKQPDRSRDDSWKRKMGVEFSGLERFRDYVVAFAFALVFVAIAGIIAYVAFG